MDDHYKNQALAEELATQLGENNSVGFYYNLAKENDHQLLRECLSWVKDYRNPRNPAALFVWKLRSEAAKKDETEDLPDQKINKENLDRLKKNLDFSWGRDRND